MELMASTCHGDRQERVFECLDTIWLEDNHHAHFAQLHA